MGWGVPSPRIESPRSTANRPGERRKRGLNVTSRERRAIGHEQGRSTDRLYHGRSGIKQSLAERGLPMARPDSNRQGEQGSLSSTDNANARVVWYLHHCRRPFLLSSIPG